MSNEQKKMSDFSQWAIGNWENDKKMTLEFELDKMGSPIPTCTNKGYSSICPKWNLWFCGKRVVDDDFQVVIGDIWVVTEKGS